MRLLWARFRTFVHATEDEDRVREALLWTMGQLESPRGRDRVERVRAKGHHGNDIVILEGALKAGPDLESAARHLFAPPEVRGLLRQELGRHVDEAGVLHLRLDKQAAVGRRLMLGHGSNAIVVFLKAEPRHGRSPRSAWHDHLASGRE